VRKRTSKRRWKRRCAIGRIIPYFAIADFMLDRWFAFRQIDINADVYEVDHGRR